MTSIERVVQIASATLGNPVKRAAKAARDTAVARLVAAGQRGETHEVIQRLQAESDVAKAEYLRLLRAGA